LLKVILVGVDVSGEMFIVQHVLENNCDVHFYDFESITDR